MTPRRRGRPRAHRLVRAAVAVAALVAAALAAGALAPGGAPRATRARPAPVASGAIVPGALHIPRPVGLRAERGATRWAAVRRGALVRARPSVHGRVLARLATRT